MLHKIIFIFLFFFSFALKTEAQNPKQLIAAVNKKFNSIKDYSADLKMEFNIPSVNIQSIKGKVYFKKPNKFRIRTHGIVFLPKQNPSYSLQLLADTNTYTAIISGEEKIENVVCKIVSVIPNKDGDMILGKFWIDSKTSLVMRSQLTTKSNGTIQMDNTYNNMNPILPEKVLFTVDITKFKIPKAIAVDINSKTVKNTSYNNKSVGNIILNFSNYKINQKLEDKVFK
jgi:outer membrane lipoprotein-sorting protein